MTTIATSIRATIALLSVAIAAESPPPYIDRWGNEHARGSDGKFSKAPSKVVSEKIDRVREMVQIGAPVDAIAADLGVSTAEGLVAVRAAVATLKASKVSEGVRQVTADPNARMVAANFASDREAQARVAAAFDRGYSSPAVVTDAIAAAGVGVAVAGSLGKMGYDAHSRAMGDLRKERDDDVAELLGKTAAAAVDTAIFAVLFVGAPQIPAILKGKDLLAVLATMTGMKVSRDTLVKAVVKLAGTLTPEQQEALMTSGAETVAECGGFLSGAIVASMMRRADLMEGAAAEAYAAIERAIADSVQSAQDLEKISEAVSAHYEDLPTSDKILLEAYTPFLKEELKGAAKRAIADAVRQAMGST